MGVLAVARNVGVDAIKDKALDGLCTIRHIDMQRWTVELADEFDPEFNNLHEEVSIEILALSRLLQEFGPQLGRPRVDTLNGSCHANMKELRFGAADGRMEGCFRIRPKAQGHSAGGGRQIRDEREEVL